MSRIFFLLIIPLSLLNTAVSVSLTPAVNHKTVNGIGLNFLQGDTLYAAQLATLDSIGSLCVHTNGEAVLRAQVLYNLFLEKEYTPVNCAGEREQQFLNVIADHVKISPNPTSGWIMLPDIDGVSRLIEVFDIAGRLVRSVNVSENELDLSDLGNGLYFLRVTRMDNGAVGSAKVIVSK